ncbi:hypothetical protein D029_1991A, partial [Vibrio parahaemolyticus 970107]
MGAFQLLQCKTPRIERGVFVSAYLFLSIQLARDCA